MWGGIIYVWRKATFAMQEVGRGAGFRAAPQPLTGE